MLVNIFGGIMKCDTIAAALLAAYDELDFRVPLVVRLEGTNVELGKKLHQGERPQDHHGRRPDRRRPEGRRRGQGGGVTRDAVELIRSEGHHGNRNDGAESPSRRRSRTWATCILSRKGFFPPIRFDRVEVNDALVDTGATILSMPKRLIEQLGLDLVRTRTAVTSAGTVDRSESTGRFA